MKSYFNVYPALANVEYVEMWISYFRTDLGLGAQDNWSFVWGSLFLNQYAPCQ